MEAKFMSKDIRLFASGATAADYHRRNCRDRSHAHCTKNRAGQMIANGEAGWLVAGIVLRRSAVEEIRSVGTFGAARLGRQENTQGVISERDLVQAFVYENRYVQRRIEEFGKTESAANQGPKAEQKLKGV